MAMTKLDMILDRQANPHKTTNDNMFVIEQAIIELLQRVEALEKNQCRCNCQPVDATSKDWIISERRDDGSPEMLKEID